MDDRPPLVRAQPSVRPAPRRTPWPLIIGVVILAALATLLAIALLTRGDGGGPRESMAASPSTPGSASAGPSSSEPITGSSASPSVTNGTSPSPSAAPTSTPANAPTSTPIAAPPDGILPVGSLVEVTADGLRIRSGPSAGADLLLRLSAGEIVFVDGEGATGSVPPVDADGYAWYPVKYASGYTDWPIEPDDASEVVRGYIAASDGAGSFVSLLAPTCPTDTALATLVATTPYARAACLGEQEIQVEGTFGCPYCDGSAGGDSAAEPAWLVGPTVGTNLLVPSWSTYPPAPGSITLAFPPETVGPTPEQEGSIIRVTGRFSDPRSAECRFGSGSEVAAEWYCRTRFVVESWEVIGTDPDFETANPNN